MVTTKHCCFGVCRSDSRYEHRDRMKGVFFIPFPKPRRDPDKCQRWVSACNREGFTTNNVTKDTYICSLHFVGGNGPTAEYPDPKTATDTSAQAEKTEVKSKAPGTEDTVKGATNGRKRLTQNNTTPSASREAGVATATPVSGKKSHYVPSVLERVPSPVKKKKKRGKRLLETLNRSLAAKKRRLLQETPTASSSDTNDTEPESLDEDDDIKPRTCDSDSCKTLINSLTLEIQALKTENRTLKEKMSKFGLNESALQNRDKQVLMLTGLPSFSVLMALFSVISPHLKLKSSLTLFQQFVLTLIKLRMNLSFDFLAFYFGVDSTKVSKVFEHCVTVMFCRLVPSLIVWPEREILRKTLPNAFRNKHFEKTVCFIDFFEIFIEKPSHVSSRARSYSANTSQHTMKYLIAVSPQGSICFISNGWGGRTSDKVITENSHFLSQLLPGDLVLANRAFNVGPSDLKVKAFTRGKTRLDPVDLGSAQSSTLLRTHIERVVGFVCQKYTLLQSTAPIALTETDNDTGVMYLDKIVKICCALTNVCESVVPSQ